MGRIRLKILNLDQDLITMDCSLNKPDRKLAHQKGDKLQGNQSFLVQDNIHKIDLFQQVQNMDLEMKLNLMPLLIKSQDRDNINS